MMKKFVFFLILQIGLSLAYGFTINTFAGSSYNTNTTTMNATLGITGYDIEDFENTTLLSNLNIQYNTNTPITSLPNIYNPVGTGFSNNTWDGTYALTNGLNNTWTSPFALNMTFTVVGGTKSFGIGLANFQSDVTAHRLYINGTDMGNLENLSNWTTGISVRNIYLRIDAAAAEIINSVKITCASATDGLVFDHIAIQSVPVPEPGTCIFLFVGLLFLNFFREKK